MKTIRNLTCLLLVALLLTACGQTTPATPGKDHQQLIIDASRSWFQYDIPPRRGIPRRRLCDRVGG